MDREEPIAVIRMNRPEARNALDARMAGELVEALDELERDDAIRCVVVTGDGKAFSAGADIREMSGLGSVDLVRSDPFSGLWNRLGSYTKPIVAALHGHVLGGGLELAMNCDLLVASDDARLGLPEINIGIIPGGGGTQRLTKAVGKHRAMEMVLTGRTIDAGEALALGLLNRVVKGDSCLEEAKALAREIASKSPLALRLAKESVNRSFEVPLHEGIDFERKNFFLLFSSRDKDEGMRAFLEKRKPTFTGR